MILQNKIEQYIEIIQELEKTFSDAKGKDILPLSFFSSSIDTLSRLKAGIYEIEALQFKMMEEHLKKTEKESSEENEINKSVNFSEFKAVEDIAPKELITEPKLLQVKLSELKSADEILIPAVNVLADVISRKITTDFGKSISLNDRFMFQREFFQGNVNEMNQAFDQLNGFQSLKEALEFLNINYSIPWDSDSGIIFKEILDKRFA